MLSRETSEYRWCAALLALVMTSPAYAVDSYRFFHVTIQTPWMIFIFLLVIILVPFILSAILHWHFAGKKASSDDDHPQSR